MRRTMAEMVLVAAMAVVAASSHAWTECYDGNCYDCPVDYSQAGYFVFEKSIVCDECWWNSDWDDFPPLKNNGCTAKISKTDSRGFTSFTFTYYDANNKKQTVKYKWQDQEGTDEFVYNGHVCSFWWDCIPFGIFLTVDGVEYGYVLKPKSQSGTSVPIEWQKARTLLGVFGERCGEGNAAGTAQLKCGKANKKGIAKVSLDITPFNGKKLSYKSVSVDVSQGGEVEVSWVQQKYRVTVDGDSFFGEPIYDGMRPACSPNAVWSADVGGSFARTAYFEFGDIPELINETDNKNWDAVMKSLWIYGGDGIGNELEVFAPVSVVMNGNKWTCPAASGLRWKKCPRNSTCTGDWEVNARNGLANLPGLRLTYNAKTGVFKGDFNLYGLFRGKKYVAKVVGVVVDGKGFGYASCPKISPEPWAVTIK